MEQKQMDEYISSGKMEIISSIDRLTILGDDTGNFETMINNNNFGFIERQGMAQHPYKRNFYCVDGSLIQWTDNPKFKAIRYEFNPNNIKLSKEREHQRAVAEIIKTMKYPKLSRVDVAFDFFGYDLSTYKITDGIGRKKNYWLGQLNQLETLYIGSPQADLRIRIYDKAREQKIKAPLKWWRVEFQLRDEGCRSIQGEMLVSGQIFKCTPQIINFFDGLRIYKLGYKTIESVKERAMVKLLLEEPETFKELASATRAKYKKILSTLPSEKDIDLQEIYVSHHDKLLKDIQEYLILAERNNVFGKIKKIDKRTQEEFEQPISYDNYTQHDAQFAVESAKMHMLYND